jgi:Rod binding domain-containing protein
MTGGINQFNVSMLNEANKETQRLHNLKNAKDDQALKKVCNDFEAFFLQQIMDISLKSSTIAGEGTGSEIIKGMYTESLAKQSAGTLGISTMLFQFLSEKEKGIR